MPSDSLKLVKNYLEKSIGDIGTRIYQKSVSKLNISENPSKDEIEKLVSHIGNMITSIYGRDKSKAVLEELHKKLTESDKPDTFIQRGIAEEIRSFLDKKAQPTEADIADYAKYISMKYGGDTKNIEKDLIEKVKANVKINEEIKNFLTRYPQPMKADVDDFINYIRFLKLNFLEDKLRGMIEKERLFRKFHTPYGVKDSSELDLLLLTPSEEDMEGMLEGLGLKHMMKKK